MHVTEGEGLEDLLQPHLPSGDGSGESPGIDQVDLGPAGLPRQVRHEVAEGGPGHLVRGGFFCLLQTPQGQPSLASQEDLQGVLTACGSQGRGSGWGDDWMEGKAWPGLG